jgi:hypothetical protein
MMPMVSGGKDAFEKFFKMAVLIFIVQWLTGITT